ncbi:Heparan sulfate 2-O-sulfotransferase pipe [Nymphon striatum]|nr:Heparan sulfate 2-O-sulfotransferase pipe [Nymphon striatum]
MDGPFNSQLGYQIGDKENGENRREDGWMICIMFRTKHYWIRFLPFLIASVTFITVWMHKDMVTPLTEPLQRKPIEIDWTVDTSNSLLVYNRVPKCGSGTLWSLMLDMKDINNYTYSLKLLGGKSPPNNSMMSKELQLKAIKYMKNLKRPAVQIAHFHYINFTEFGYSSPVYINLIRDPVDKFVSFYYYSWFLKFKHERNGKNASKSQISRDTTAIFKKCFDTGEEDECRVNIGFNQTKYTHTKLNIAYFCGHDVYCSTHGNKDALQKARYVVEKEYKVVGILEDLNTTFSVLEDKIPIFFRNIRNYYNEFPKQVHKANKSEIKDQIDYIKDALRKNMTLEYDFYEFIKQRLYKQYYYRRSSILSK